MPLHTVSRKNGLSTATVLLAVLVLALLALNQYTLDMAVDTSPAQLGAKDGARAPGIGTGALEERRVGSQADYAETVARPLFNATRRPVASAKPQIGEPSSTSSLQPLQMQLVGLAITTSRGGRALVRSGADRNGTWVSIGDELRGWRLSEINSDRAIFVAGGSQQVLLLSKGERPQ